MHKVQFEAKLIEGHKLGAPRGQRATGSFLDGGYRSYSFPKHCL
jgi:hypothetical protein